MRPREFVVPLGLLGAIAAFFVVQGREVQRGRPPKPAETVESQAGTAAPSAPPFAPQSGAVESSPSGDSNALATQSDAALTARTSAEPAPTRDNAHVAELLREGSQGTYMPELLVEQSNFLMRWPSHRRTVRVWIERNVSLADWDETYPVVAERAFEEWQQAGFPLRFDMLRDSMSTEIQIRWISQFPAEDGAKIGLAKKVRDQHGWLVAGEITIATHDATGQPLPASVVAGAARHEIGHILGLGHSKSPGDVMYPESRTPAISTADRRTLHLLYLLPPGPVR